MTEKKKISGGLSIVQISELSLANNGENKVNKDVKIENGDMRVAQLSLEMKDCEQEIESLRSKLEQNEWHLKTKVMTPVFSFEEHLEIFGWMEDIIVSEIILSVTGENEKNPDVKIKKQVKRKAENLQEEEYPTTPTKKPKIINTLNPPRNPKPQETQ